MTTSVAPHGPRIVTASWLASLPQDVLRVSISRGAPRQQRGFRKLSALAPGAYFRSVSEAEYIRLYSQQLAELDPVALYGELSKMARGNRSVALCCFERPATDDGWCHRSLAATWLAAKLDMIVPEFGYEHLAQDEHPMLPPSLRRSA